MPRVLRFKRYSRAGLSNVIGADGELIVDTTKRTVTVHDGITPGGTRLATENYANGIYDPPTDDPNNIPVLFTRANNTITLSTPVTQQFDAGIYHYNVNLNSIGEVVSISAWGPGSTGLVDGY